MLPLEQSDNKDPRLRRRPIGAELSGFRAAGDYRNHDDRGKRSPSEMLRFETVRSTTHAMPLDTAFQFDTKDRDAILPR